LQIPANALNFVCVNHIPMTDEKKLPDKGPLQATFLYDILPQALLLPHPLLRF